MSGSVDPDEMQHSVVSRLGLHCLLRHAPIHTVNMVVDANAVYISRVERKTIVSQMIVFSPNLISSP